MSRKFEIEVLELRAQVIFSQSGDACSLIYSLLTLTRPISLPPHTHVPQKIADHRCLIANSIIIDIFQKMRIKNLRGVSEVKFKKLDSFTSETSKNYLIRNILCNGRVRVNTPIPL